VTSYGSHYNLLPLYDVYGDIQTNMIWTMIATINDREKRIEMVAVVFLLLLTLFLRLHLLGHSPFRADTMNFYSAALSGQSLLELWKNPPWLNQIPLSESITLVLAQLGVPVTPFFVRLPFALMGTLAVGILWWFTRSFLGRWPAITVLVLASMNPFQIYYSRMSYYYAGVILFSMLMFFCFWMIHEGLRKKTPPQRGLLIGWFAFAVIAAHMHMSVWVVIAFQGLWLLLMGLRLPKPALISYVRRMAVGVVISLLLLIRWVWRAIKMVLEDTEQLGHDLLSEYIQIPPQYFAGQNIPALALLVVICALSVYACMPGKSKEPAFSHLAFLILIHWLVALAYVAVIGGGLAKISYFSSLWPLYMLFLGAGTTYGIQRIAKGRQAVFLSTWMLLMAAYVGLTFVPAKALVELEGKPTPYYMINEWVENHLPAGTPILVDRWFEPWNELAIHNPNAIPYTFTVPDEPFDNYIGLHWRQTAETFLKRFPGAAYLELTPLRYAGRIEPWDFPAKHFERRVVFTNTPARVLQQWKVNPGDFGVDSTRVEVFLYYNEFSDLISTQAFRADGIAWRYGLGWTYFKPWRPRSDWSENLTQSLWIQAGAYLSEKKLLYQTGEIHRLDPYQAQRYFNLGRWADYMVPSPKAGLHVVNTSDEMRQVVVQVTGIALSGPIRARLHTSVIEFPAMKLVSYSVPVAVPTGEHTIAMQWPEQALLLVLDLQVMATK